MKSRGRLSRSAQHTEGHALVRDQAEAGQLGAVRPDHATVIVQRKKGGK